MPASSIISENSALILTCCKLTHGIKRRSSDNGIDDRPRKLAKIVTKRAQYEPALAMLQLSYPNNVIKPDESALRHSRDLIADMAVFRAAVAMVQLSLSESIAKPVESEPSHLSGQVIDEEAYEAALAMVQLSLSESVAKPVESAPSHPLSLDVNEEVYDAALAMVQLSHSESVTKPEESALHHSLYLVVSKEAYDAALAMLQLSRSKNVVEPAESALRHSLGLAINKKSTSTYHDPLQGVTHEPIKTSFVGKGGKGAKLQKTRNLGTEEFFMPSAENDWKFKCDSTSGLTSAQLNSLLKPPARTPMSESDAKGLYTNGVGALSYQHLGARPKKGLADKLVAELETRNIKEQHNLDHRLQESFQKQNLEDEQELDKD